MTQPDIPSPRQTLSYIRHLLQSRGIQPKNKLGQNFLVDLNLLDLIVQTAELTREDAVLEVGTGTGSLTSRLSDHAGAVVSVEIAADFHKLAQGPLMGRPNVTLIHADALERKNEMNPGVMSAWEEAARNAGCTRRKLIANLPYAVATPVIGNLLICDVPIERMVVMVQMELAERMTALPSTKDYSSLAVLVQSLADVQIVRRLGPQVFWPMPKVDSAIVHIHPNAEKRALIPDPRRYRAFLRDLYTHRRKNLRQAIAGWPSGRKDKKEVDAKLAELGIDGSMRAETLDLEQHRRLCQAFANM
jgi:16S rRNA (adenine1518-N6/adenine1519-N6)-dimethyltransferase